MVRMEMLSHDQTKLVYQLNVHQIVATVVIDDGMYMIALNDEKHVYKIMVL